LFVGPRHERVERRTLGVSFEARTMLNAAPVGLGLVLFGNVNRESSFAAVALTVQLGKLR
jgi:hypothetical protein